MSSDKHVVELNGKKFDAVTGKPIIAKAKAVAKPAAPVAVKKTAKLPAGPRVMDGIVGKSNRQATATKVHQKTQHSKTLMRSLVKKPAVIKPSTSAARTKAAAKPATSAAQPTAVAAKTAYPEIIKIEHVVHAANIKRSKLISKFGAPATSLKTDVIPVKSAPHQPVPADALAASTPISMPHAQQPSAASILANGLAAANSHTQPKLKKPSAYHRTARRMHIRPRILAASGGALVALVVAGFFAYNNVPNVAMKVAATRAGFSASLPTYQPAGFSLRNPIAYNPGQVSLQYNSNSDNRNFSVIQRASAWNSEALLDNVILTGKKSYQTYQANGRTIYIYDGNNATWVDGGVWYQIEGNSNLSSDQLLKIANSL